MATDHQRISVPSRTAPRGNKALGTHVLLIAPGTEGVASGTVPSARERQMRKVVLPRFRRRHDTMKTTQGSKMAAVRGTTV